MKLKQMNLNDKYFLGTIIVYLVLTLVNLVFSLTPSSLGFQYILMTVVSAIAYGVMCIHYKSLDKENK